MEVAGEFDSAPIGPEPVSVCVVDVPGLHRTFPQLSKQAKTVDPLPIGFFVLALCRPFAVGGHAANQRTGSALEQLW